MPAGERAHNLRSRDRLRRRTFGDDYVVEVPGEPEMILEEEVDLVLDVEELAVENSVVIVEDSKDSTVVKVETPPRSASASVDDVVIEVDAVHGDRAEATAADTSVDTTDTTTNASVNASTNASAQPRPARPVRIRQPVRREQPQSPSPPRTRPRNRTPKPRPPPPANYHGRPAAGGDPLHAEQVDAKQTLDPAAATTTSSSLASSPSLPDNDLLDEASVYFVEPPEFSDGTADFHPPATFEEAFVRERYLTQSFLVRLWKTHFNRHLTSVGSGCRGHAGGVDDCSQPATGPVPVETTSTDEVDTEDTVDYWQRFFHRDIINQSRDDRHKCLSTTRTPLDVVFYVPLTEDDPRWHGFMLQAGRVLERKLTAVGDVRKLSENFTLSSEELLRRVSVAAAAAAAVATSPPPSSPVFSARSPLIVPSVVALDDESAAADDLLVDVEAMSEDGDTMVDEFAVMQLLSEPDVEAACTSACTYASALDDLASSSAMDAEEGPFDMDPLCTFKLSALPTNYKLYDRLVVRYPPPPPFFQSLKKPLFPRRADGDEEDASADDTTASPQQSSDDHDIPRVTVTRSFAVFGHPGCGDSPMGVSDFAEHLWWLYQMAASTVITTPPNMLGYSKEAGGGSCVSSPSAPGVCECHFCPYSSHLFTGYRRGERVWVLLAELQDYDEKQCVDASVLDVATELGLHYWGAEILGTIIAEGELQYRVRLESFPAVFLQNRHHWRDAEVRVSAPVGSVYPYLRLRPELPTAVEFRTQIPTGMRGMEWRGLSSFQQDHPHPSHAAARNVLREHVRFMFLTHYERMLAECDRHRQLCHMLVAEQQHSAAVDAPADADQPLSPMAVAFGCERLQRNDLLRLDDRAWKLLRKLDAAADEDEVVLEEDAAAATNASGVSESESEEEDEEDLNDEYAGRLLLLDVRDFEWLPERTKGSRADMVADPEAEANNIDSSSSSPGTLHAIGDVYAVEIGPSGELLQTAVLHQNLSMSIGFVSGRFYFQCYPATLHAMSIQSVVGEPRVAPPVVHHAPPSAWSVLSLRDEQALLERRAQVKLARSTAQSMVDTYTRLTIEKIPVLITPGIAGAAPIAPTAAGDIARNARKRSIVVEVDSHRAPSMDALASPPIFAPPSTCDDITSQDDRLAESVSVQSASPPPPLKKTRRPRGALEPWPEALLLQEKAAEMDQSLVPQVDDVVGVVVTGAEQPGSTAAVTVKIIPVADIHADGGSDADSGTSTGTLLRTATSEEDDEDHEDHVDQDKDYRAAMPSRLGRRRSSVVLAALPPRRTSHRKHHAPQRFTQERV